ncbi:MAG: DNA polymerase A family protein [Myxococcota bacterium]
MTGAEAPFSETAWAPTHLPCLVPLGPRDDPNHPPNAVVLTDGTATEVIPAMPESQAASATLRRCCARADRAFLCAHAKPCLRGLLRVKLDIARPICLLTLHQLLHADPPPWLQHAARGVDEAVQLARRQRDCLGDLLPRLTQHKLRRVARLECLVLRAFASMEHRGFPIDQARWRQALRQTQTDLAASRQEVLAHTGNQSEQDLFGHHQVNLDDGRQVKLLLQQVLGNSIPNTNQETLRKLDHPMAKALLRYRELAKLSQTYGENFLQFIDPRTDRIHACFEPLGTATGRAACHSPNLQNLPNRVEFRRCIHPEGDRVLVTADYASCELRIMADLCGDPNFLRAFEEGRDLHSEVATRLFGVPVDKENNSHLRKQAKTITFGLLYGMGTSALARRLNIPPRQADDLMHRYFAAHPRLKAYLDHSVQQALQRGFARTTLGRRLPLDQEQDGHDRARFSRIARNMPIQGTGADMLKLAMARLHERLAREFPSAGLVNTVHDELVVECANEHATGVAALVKREMEGAEQTLLPNVKPQVDVHVGRHWEH